MLLFYHARFIKGEKMRKSLGDILSSCHTEEEVKSRFAKFFNIELDTQNYIDLYTRGILFEFKYDVNLKSNKQKAKTVAQALYYIRRLKYGKDTKVVSTNICIVDKNEAILLKTESLSNYYLKSKATKYDWDLAPSSPCKKLVEDLSKEPLIRDCHTYQFDVEADEQNFVSYVKEKVIETIALFDDKKEINEDNFYEIFKYWESLFGNYVENGHKSSEYYVTDIETGKSACVGNSSVIFRMNDGSIIEKILPIRDYNYFWNIYEKVMRPKAVIAIRQKMDRMSEINMRRFTGEFFTPLEFAKKGLDYIHRVVGPEWWKTGKYRFWDMAAGTGNLEFILPEESLKYCYISTLLEDDANYCKKLYKESTVFQYDYLNDDIDDELGNLDYKKLPKNLQEDLMNPNIKWIIFFNPPYVTANNNERSKKVNKDNVSITKIRSLMNEDNLGETSREVYSQFLYRISKEFANKETYMGIFSKIKYLNSDNDKKMRNSFFDYKYEKGFMFSSEEFDGCRAKFPIGFLVWNLSKRIHIEKQNITLDVYNTKVEKIATKTICTAPQETFLSKWIQRPRCTVKYPPLSAALTVASNNKDRRDRIAEGFLASFMCKGNDFANQNYTALLSAPYVSAGAISMTPENFEKCMIIHAVRRIPKTDWTNDRDQFRQPLLDLSKEFISDCVIWSLFSNSNNTTAMRDVVYEGIKYQIKNNLYPFLLDEISNWDCSLPNIREDIAIANIRGKDRFASMWINNNKKYLSKEALSVLNTAKKIYIRFYKHLSELNWPRYKIKDWDVGWYQIKMALKDGGYEEQEDVDAFKNAIKVLSDKLLPKFYQNGFLRDELKMFD